MEFVIDSNQSYYFESNGRIEFDEIFTKTELDRLTVNLENVLEKRLQASKDKFYRFTPKEWYAEGRDLWRDSKEIARILLNGKLGKVAGGLIHQKNLRLGADQWIFSMESLPWKGSLNQSFPFQGIELGAIIALKNPEASEAEENSPLFPRTPGGVTFFRADLPFDFPENFIVPGEGAYLLVVITNAKSVYSLQLNDPCTHTLKKIGFGFGDRLSDSDHPYLI